MDLVSRRNDDTVQTILTLLSVCYFFYETYC